MWFWIGVLLIARLVVVCVNSVDVQFLFLSF